ncbi:hypothetical protein FOT80_21800 [Serratia fonticola]|nr:hypothetical protein [Serratia fonticola]
MFVAVSVNAVTENAPQTSAKSLEFDSSFLNVDDVQSIYLSRFAEGASRLPGIYKTALYVNGQLIRNTDIEFKSWADKSVYPCLTSDINKNIAYNFSPLKLFRTVV